MGHYDSCKDETFAIMYTKCKKAENKKHKFMEISHGVLECKHCKQIIYTT